VLFVASMMREQGERECRGVVIIHLAQSLFRQRIAQRKQFNGESILRHVERVGAAARPRQS